MDQDLQLKYAPRRGARRGCISKQSDVAGWVRALDWESNDYDFFRLCDSVFGDLDRHYRQHGCRLDQFMSRNELRQEARHCLAIYRDARLSDCIGVYRYLFATLDIRVGGFANELLDRRRAAAEALLQCCDEFNPAP
jgi:hypothetical protein